MADRICVDAGCNKPVGAHGAIGRCPVHYRQYRRDHAPSCRIERCEKPVHTARSGLCSTHYARWKRTGDPLTPLSRLPNVGKCSVEDCDAPMRKRTLCAAHYAHWRRHGTALAPFAFKWADESTCLICAKPNGGWTSRKFCSPNCQAIFARHGGAPADPACVRCGVQIELLGGGRNGRRKRVDTKLCHRCKTQSRTEATPGELALRDGPYCQLCGCDVDLRAVFPDAMRPSVDHIIPRSWGGSDDADNNQLTHLLCNQIKSDRYEGVSSRTSP